MKIVVLLLIASQLAACASIMNGTHQNIALSSNPPGATAKTNSGVQCLTPCVLSLERSANQTIMIEKEGYEQASAALAKSASGWLWGDLVVGGLIGLAIDFATGAAYKLDPAIINPTLAKK